MEGVGFTNGPASTQIAEVYGRAFFPLLEPTPVAAGDKVTLSIQATLTNNEYTWDWATQIRAANNSGAVKAEFEQSTAFDGALDERYLAKHIADRRPVLGQEGEIDRFILTNIDGRATMDEIAGWLRAAFPERFETPAEAIVYIHQLIQHY
jgi:hypothetical protein